MISKIVRIQLVDSDQLGFLDVKAGTDFPVNKSVGDIRDISERSGSFSKTITLVGNKNNNHLLNYYFDLNVESGLFDINKIQPCIVIQNGVIVLDNMFLRLVKVVTKEKNGELMYDDVEYEVQIRDSVSDFYKELNNRNLEDLTNWEMFNHTYTLPDITASFSHTVDDGYKYVLPYVNDDQINIKEVLPGIYAKQIWDRIHLQNGYTYDWDSLSSKTVQFDKLIMPYSGDLSKTNEDFLNDYEVKADKLSTDQINGMFVGALNDTNFINLTIDENISDPATIYASPSTYTVPFTVNAPDTIQYKVNIEWELEVNNVYNEILFNGMSGACATTPSNCIMRPMVGIVESGIYQAGEKLIPDSYELANAPGCPFDGEPFVQLNINNDLEWILPFQVPALSTRPVCSGSNSFVMDVTNVNLLDNLITESRLVWEAFGEVAGIRWRTATNSTAVAQLRLITKSISIEILPTSDTGLFVGIPVNLQDFLPKKVKQSEFIKSIMQKYNLFSIPDKENDRKIIYKTRDEFYGGGKLVDLTTNLCKEVKQELYFLPEMTSKKVILSYKDDSKDEVLTRYLDTVGETYAQTEITFDNENIKGTERKEELFSPTINLKTAFDAVLPYLNPDFSNNYRILIDGGETSCYPYKFIESDSVSVFLNSYPYMGMLDKPFEPTFSIEYSLPDYYTYSLAYRTINNLYNNHWQRTFAQINSGKMFKAYFWLNEAEYKKIELNDIIKVKENFFYINKIVDYNANAYAPTLLELLTVEEELVVPTTSGGASPGGSGAPGGSGMIETHTYSERMAVAASTSMRQTMSTVAPDGVDITQSKGYGNSLPNNFRGQVIGDYLTITENGYHINQNAFTNSGLKISDKLEMTGYGLIIRDKDGTLTFTKNGIVTNSYYMQDGYWEQDYTIADGIGMTIDDNNVIISGELVLSTTQPVTGTADISGMLGSIRYDDNYMYLKVSTGWKRVSLSTF